MIQADLFTEEQYNIGEELRIYHLMKILELKFNHLVTIKYNGESGNNPGLDNYELCIRCGSFYQESWHTWQLN